MNFGRRIGCDKIVIDGKLLWVFGGYCNEKGEYYKVDRIDTNLNKLESLDCDWK